MERLKIKKIVLGTGLLLVFISIILPIFEISAQTPDNTYTVLAPLPGTTLSDCPPGSTDCKTDLKTYVEGFFKLAIGLSAVFAVLMIVIGGFQYISSDAIMKKSEGKERIKNAVLGLVLVISAWLILNTINPNLLKFSLDISPVTTVAPAGGVLGGELSAGTGKKVPGYTLTPEQVAKNAEMVADLKKYNVTVNNNGKPCTNGEISGCTNLIGMTEAAYSGVKEFAKECVGCNVVITGGTEGGHASHGPNLSAIDLSSSDPKLETFIKNSTQTAPVRTTSLGPIYTIKMADGTNATFLKESNPPHWHVVFGGK